MVGPPFPKGCPEHNRFFALPDIRAAGGALMSLLHFLEIIIPACAATRLLVWASGVTRAAGSEERS